MSLVDDLENPSDYNQTDVAENKRQRRYSRRLSRKSIFGDHKEFVSHITDPLGTRLEEVFSLFDSGNKGEIDVRELGTVIRALGCVITEAELQTVREEIEEVENSCVPLDRFIEFMRKAIGEQKYKPADADTLLKAFKLFDKNNCGYITKEYLEKIITEYGESFTPEEMRDMMNVACDPKTGKINYEYYMNLLIENIPSEKDVYALNAHVTEMEKHFLATANNRISDEYVSDLLKVD